MFWKIINVLKDFETKHGLFENVLDVGSRNINGSVREWLHPTGKLVGIDMIKGKDVDVVGNANELDKFFEKDYFDLITCTETLEHDKRFWLTVGHMRNLLRPGGWLFISTPSIHFFKHDFPDDYYRFTTSVYEQVFFEGFEEVYLEEYFDEADPVKEKPNNTIIGYARKPKRKL